MSECNHMFEVDETCDRCGFGSVYLLAKAQERIQQLESERRWIPVSERLPDLEVSVLTYYCGVCVGELYEDGAWEISGFEGFVLEEVTHWMPLPPPPKENDRDR